MRLEVGQRVRLKRTVERYPHFIADAGMTGTVVYVDAGMVGVRMDEHLDGCEEWDNEIMWYPPDWGGDQTSNANLPDDLEVLP